MECHQGIPTASIIYSKIVLKIIYMHYLPFGIKMVFIKARERDLLFPMKVL